MRKRNKRETIKPSPKAAEKLTNKDAIAVNDVYKDKISAALDNKDYTALKEEFNKI